MRSLWLATVALIGLSGGIALGNYAATQGAGTNFGSVVIGGVHFMSQLLCDATTANQCAAVNASGQLAIQAPPTIPLASGASTSANQSSQITQETATAAALGTVADAASCTGSQTTISCLKQIDSDIKAAIPAGTNTIGGLFLVPTTTGGLSNSVTEPGASDNHAVIKNGAGQVYGIHVWNNSATINYGRLYNAGTGFNGCNSATNLVYEFHIPASTSDAGFVVPIPQGIAFATGISLCVTSSYGQTSTANATASAISLNVQYN